MDTKYFSALADANRIKIVELLIERPLSVGEIANKLNLNQPQTSKHLLALHAAGLVEKKALANKRIYQLKAEAFAELDKWLFTFRRLWEERLDRLEVYLEHLQSEENQK